MNEKQLALLLAAARRDEQLERGERLLRGELSPEEEAALRADKDADSQQIDELFRPLDAPFKQKLLADWVKQAKAEQAKLDPPVTPLRRPARRIFMVAAPLLLAASLALFLKPWATSGVDYALDITTASVPRDAQGNIVLGGPASATEAKEVKPGQCLFLKLRPAAAMAAPPEVRAYFLSADAAQPWPLRFQRGASGVLTNAGDCAAVPALPAGDWQLHIAVGKNLPEQDALLQMLRSGQVPSRSGWTVVRRPLRVLSN